MSSVSSLISPAQLLTPGAPACILPAVLATGEPRDRAYQLRAIAPILPADLMREALDAGARLGDDLVNIVFGAYAPLLGEEDLEHAVALARGIDDLGAWVWGVMAARDPHRYEQIARDAKAGDEVAQAVITRVLGPRTLAEWYEVWNALLHGASFQRVDDILRHPDHLLEIVEHLRGKQADADASY
jgi:hypothetical protein